ncbi:MAG: hypothetical protein H6621_06375 [Halobacteriovoraceae bacterium]|nr:hypothetical protein [Halobacteriovoraceae bacterium]
MKDILSLRLRNLNKAGKVFVLGYLACISLGYLYALINVGQSVGFFPKQIAINYYGSDTKIEAPKETTGDSGEEEFSFDEVQETKAEELVRPSFKKIIAEGHFHLLGMASFFFGLVLFGLFTGINENLKILAAGAPFVAIIFDNASFMAIRFLGPQFAYLTIAAGALMGFSFSLLFFSILWEVLQKGEKNA